MKVCESHHGLECSMCGGQRCSAPAAAHPPPPAACRLHRSSSVVVPAALSCTSLRMGALQYVQHPSVQLQLRSKPCCSHNGDAALGPGGGLRGSRVLPAGKASNGPAPVLGPNGADRLAASMATWQRSMFYGMATRTGLLAPPLSRHAHPPIYVNRPPALPAVQLRATPACRSCGCAAFPAWT